MQHTKTFPSKPAPIDSPASSPLELLLGVLLLTVPLLGVLACGPSAAAGSSASEHSATGERESAIDTAADSEFEAESGPVVIELFTSQGCSSCPPADKLLARLDADPRLAGKVLPLAFHVDYWNSIGWRDPFSSKAWSERQERYAHNLEAGRLYTPQLVVAGREHCVGSSASQVRELIDEALARKPAARVALASIQQQGNQLEVRTSATLQGAVEGQQELMVALVENDLTTKIQSGENAHRTLNNERVVRRLERATTLDPGDRGSNEATVSFALDPSWNRDHLQVVAFVQDRDTMVIHGAAEGKVGP